MKNKTYFLFQTLDLKNRIVQVFVLLRLCWLYLDVYQELGGGLMVHTSHLSTYRLEITPLQLVPGLQDCRTAVQASFQESYLRTAFCAFISCSVTVAFMIEAACIFYSFFF